MKEPKVDAERAKFDQMALRVLTEMRNAIGQPMVYGADWHVEFARRLREAWELEGMPTGIELSGYGDDDERWGDTVAQYVEQAANDHDYDDLISGEPFAIACFWHRHEQWRTVSASPIKCERVK
jgi:hypothetical protein